MPPTSPTIDAPAPATANTAPRGDRDDQVATKGANKPKPSANPVTAEQQEPFPWTTLLFSLATIAVIAIGWLNRDWSDLTAETGLGYALGIVGASVMLLLLLYPMRKRLLFMRRWGPVRTWFSTHMVMGVIAPVCILFHANFQLGSLNSNVALWCTLVVAGSGAIGRFIFSKVHYGLYGGRATLTALRENALLAKGQLSAEFAFAPQLRIRLQAIEDATLAPTRNPFKKIFRLLLLGPNIRLTRWRLRRFMTGALNLRAKQDKWTRSELRQHKKNAKRFLNAYLTMVRKVAELGFYERVFSFWHVLHLPLFFMLVVAGILHVVAVHMY